MNKRTSASSAFTAENNSSKKYIFRERGRVNQPLTNQLSYSSVNSALTDENSDYPRVPLGFKVKVKVYRKYMQLPRKLKRFIRDTVEQLILNIDKAEIRTEEKHTIINMPINILVSKTEIAKITMDPEVLYEKIRILEAENRELKDIIKYYKKQVKELQDQNTMLLKVKKKYYGLKQQLALWLTWLRKGHVKYVIKEIEKVSKQS